MNNVYPASEEYKDYQSGEKILCDAHDENNVCAINLLASIWFIFSFLFFSFNLFHLVAASATV